MNPVHYPINDANGEGEKAHPAKQITKQQKNGQENRKNGLYALPVEARKEELLMSSTS